MPHRVKNLKINSHNKSGILFFRPKSPLTNEDAVRVLEQYVEYYNNKRLHSAIGYVTPMDKLYGREDQIFKDRDRKLEKARQLRKRRSLEYEKTA